MVSFQQIQDAIATNVHKQTVLNIRLLPSLPVDQFKIPQQVALETKIPKKVRVEPKPEVAVVHTVDHASDSEESLPPPTRCIGSKTTTPKVEQVVQPVDVSPVRSPATAPATTTARPVPTLPIPNRSRDPICIAVEQQDPMYAIATPNVRTSLECEEARRLEAMLDTLYKEQSGRSRGWTKTKLTEFLVPRAAAGGHVPAKAVFDWSAIWTQKEASALLDFVCLAKGIRLAVWKSETEVGLWPAADKEGTKPPLIHVGSTGMSLADRPMSNIRMLAPYSVVAALEKLSVDELESVAEKMQVSLPSGKKTEKAAFLASVRMRMRL